MSASLSSILTSLAEREFTEVGAFHHGEMLAFHLPDTFNIENNRYVELQRNSFIDGARWQFTEDQKIIVKTTKALETAMGVLLSSNHISLSYLQRKNLIWQTEQRILEILGGLGDGL